MLDENKPSGLTHIDATGTARMVDVSAKDDTVRIAIAGGEVHMLPETLRAIQGGQIKKGDVLTVARIAGIMAAKRTSELIPLCHPIALTRIDLEFAFDELSSRILIEAVAHTVGKTGVEMEALTAVSVAALTIYDMAKAIDRGMVIGAIQLLEKSGGKSGTFRAEGRHAGLDR